MENFIDDAWTPEERRSLPARLVRRIRSNARLLVILGGLALFLFLLQDVLSSETMKIDVWAYWLFVQKLRHSLLTPVMMGFSALGNAVVLIVLLLVIAAFAPGRRPGWCCAVNLVLSSLLNVGMKMLVQRPRPVGFRLIEETGFSFPSGHSMMAMAFFGLIVWLIWHYERDRRKRLMLSGAFAVVIAMIGISRIYLGVHYASDVLAGFTAALIWLALYTRLAVPLFLGEPVVEGIDGLSADTKAGATTGAGKRS